MSETTIVTVPCFSGAPWDLSSLSPLAHRPLRTMRLPEGVDEIEAYADFVEDQVADLDDFVLVGDSFGAVVALAVATRRPRRLAGLVLSGGFASSPIDSVLGRAKIAASRFLPGPLYRHVTLRLHAAALASPYDDEGDVPLSPAATRRLFLEHTPWASYVARGRAAFSADYRADLGKIEAPTLILTPSHDTLIGPHAAGIMRDGISDAEEVVLDRTGHMFRFTHPVRYARAIDRFLEARVDSGSAPSGKAA